MDASGRVVTLEDLRLANRVHLAEIDEAMRLLSERSAEQGQPVRCAAGCAACCRYWVEATPLEAIDIADELRAKGRDTPLMRAKLESVGNLMQRKTHEEYWRLGRYCPLLGPDRKCSVYSVRPATCRLHQSVTDPALCDESRGDRIDVDGLMADHAAFARASTAHAPLRTWPALGPMPLLVHRALTDSI